MQVDAAAEKFATRYPELVDELIALFREAKEIDKEVSRVNSLALDGEHRRLRRVELVARDMDEFSRSQPELAKELRLVDLENSATLLWPPPSPSIATLIASPPHYHPGANWSDPQFTEMRAAEIRDEQEKVARYYQNLTEQQEERVNAEERQRVAAQRRA